MKKILSFSLFVVFSALSAFAGHVDTYGIGAKATSMGGAVVAGIDDPYAVYYNPAAMVNIKRPTLSLGTHIVDPSLTIKEYDVETSGLLADPSFGAEDISDRSPLLVVPHFGYVTPINDKFTFGMAFYVPYGLDLRWDDNGATNPAAYNTFHSWYKREVLTPSLSYKVNDKFSLGAGISLGKAQAGNERIRYVPAKLKSSAAWTAVLSALRPGDPTNAATAAGLAAKYTALGDATFNMSYEDEFNISYNFGALYKFNDKWSAGITYRSFSHVDLEGTAKVTPEQPLWGNDDLDSNTSVDTPDSVQFGVQYMITPKLRVEADIVRTFWSNIDSYTVEFEDDLLNVAGASEEVYQRHWMDTWQYRLGMEYKLNDTVDLRAGYYYDESTVPKDTFDVLWPDSNKHVFSLGAGFHFGNVTLDTVVQYIYIEKLTINLGASENLNDSYVRELLGYSIHDAEVEAVAEGHIWSFGITASYKF
ncbi:MAG: OmpP1/FadL family transporter [Deferribacterales bacterium]